MEGVARDLELIRLKALIPVAELIVFYAVITKSYHLGDPVLSRRPRCLRLVDARGVRVGGIQAPLSFQTAPLPR